MDPGADGCHWRVAWTGGDARVAVARAELWVAARGPLGVPGGELDESEEEGEEGFSSTGIAVIDTQIFPV